MTPASPAAPGTAPGGGAQEAATPGQAARKAWRDHWDIASERGRGTPRWDSLAYEAEAWDVAAEAGNRAGLARVLAEAARYKAERDAAREELATCRERNAAISVQLDQYRDERDHCRAALEAIRDRRGHPGGDWAIAIARAALEGTP